MVPPSLILDIAETKQVTVPINIQVTNIIFVCIRIPQNTNDKKIIMIIDNTTTNNN